MILLFLHKLKNNISDWLFFNPIDWTALAAIFTFLAVLVALGIPIWEHFRNKKAQMRVASQSTVIPIRSELLRFLESKWDNFQVVNPFCGLQAIKKDFPIEYFQVKKKIRDDVEHSARLFTEFINLNEKIQPRIQEIIGKSAPQFFRANKIKYSISNEADPPTSEEWRNLHWAGSIGGGYRAVRLYALVLWGINFSTYLAERKIDLSLPNAVVSKINPSVAKVRSISLTVMESDKLVAVILGELENEEGFNNYNQKWRELYKNGEKLLAKIDTYIVWLSSQ